jgi:hypothetical protein
MSKLCYLVLKQQVQEMHRFVPESKPVLFKEDMSALDIVKGGVKQPEQSQIQKPRKGLVQQRKPRFYSGCLDKK